MAGMSEENSSSELNLFCAAFILNEERTPKLNPIVLFVQRHVKPPTVHNVRDVASSKGPKMPRYPLHVNRYTILESSHPQGLHLDKVLALLCNLKNVRVRRVRLLAMVLDPICPIPVISRIAVKSS